MTPSAIRMHRQTGRSVRRTPPAARASRSVWAGDHLGKTLRRMMEGRRAGEDRRKGLVPAASLQTFPYRAVRPVKRSEIVPTDLSYPLLGPNQWPELPGFAPAAGGIHREHRRHDGNLDQRPVSTCLPKPCRASHISRNAARAARSTSPKAPHLGLRSARRDFASAHEVTFASIGIREPQGETRRGDAGYLEFRDGILVETGRDIPYIEHWHRTSDHTGNRCAASIVKRKEVPVVELSR